MGQTNMHENGWAGTNNVLATCASFIFLFIAKFSLSDWAAIAAILAAVTTAGLNIAKYIEMKKKIKTPNNGNSEL
jgi:hypothetical protein